MINAKVLKELREGTTTPKEVIYYFVNNYPTKTIATDYVKLLMETPTENNKIVVSQEEYAMITSLFKIRGTKIVDGEIVKESRGRKRKE